MRTPDKSQNSRIMTLLVLAASWVSGAVAVAVVAVALWPKAAGPVLPSSGSPAMQGVQSEITTPAEPEIELLDVPAPKPFLQLEKLPPQAVIPN